jgi:hypothetical protein
MKSKIINCVFVLLILSTAGCLNSDSPRSVAEKFLKAISTQDYETAKKYGTEETERLLEQMSGYSKMIPDSLRPKELRFDITREEVSGDNAVIFYREDGREGELQLPLVKLEGKWKVLLSKESINSSDSGSIDVGATNTDTVK